MYPNSRSLVFLLAYAVSIAGQSATAQTDTAALAHARDILRYAPIIDGHNDLPDIIRGNFGGDVEHYDLSVRTSGETDIPRLREGMVGAQFWSVFVPSTLSPLESMRRQLEQIDLARRLIDKYPDDLMFATSVADIEFARKQGKIASLLGIEGGHTIVNSLGVLRSYYDLGARYMTLTHFRNNDWADSANDEVQHEGLTEFGREVIREMNRLGMLIDLSHVSAATMNDVLDVSEAPVIFSHSSARALSDSPRNVPDSVLRRVATNGGIVMVTFISRYITDERRIWQDGLAQSLSGVGSGTEAERMEQQYRHTAGAPPATTLSDVADHIEHVVKISGVDHVGIGSDFYGAPPEAHVHGLEDVSCFPRLIAELIGRGWTDEDLAKLSRNNLLRVLAEAEDIAGDLNKARAPSLRTIDELDGPPDAARVQ